MTNEINATDFNAAETFLAVPVETVPISQLCSAYILLNPDDVIVIGLEGVYEYKFKGETYIFGDIEVSLEDNGYVVGETGQEYYFPTLYFFYLFRLSGTRLQQERESGIYKAVTITGNHVEAYWASVEEIRWRDGNNYYSAPAMEFFSCYAPLKEGVALA